MDAVIVEFELDERGNRINTRIPVRPHLFYRDGWWTCHSPERTDYGSTPQWAYHFWQYWTRQLARGYRAP